MMLSPPDRPAGAFTVQTEDEFCGWLGAALPGDSCVYHSGFLMIDADPTASRLPEETRRTLAALRDRARLAFELGLAHLFQARVGLGVFNYIAVARVPRSFKESRAALALASTTITTK